MIALIQRVNQGKVFIDKKLYSQIGKGYLIFLGIFNKDNQEDIIKLVDKIAHLRIMADQHGKMNKSILQTKGEILVVSQFTLCAKLKGGRRPDFFPAMEPCEAKKLYWLFIQKLQKKNLTVKTGEFGAYMEVQIVNDGPVTIILNSKD